METVLAAGVPTAAVLAVTAVEAQTHDTATYGQDMNAIRVPEHKIVTTGINILGKSPDCASGGAGCP